MQREFHLQVSFYSFGLVHTKIHVTIFGMICLSNWEIRRPLIRRSLRLMIELRVSSSHGVTAILLRHACSVRILYLHCEKRF